MHAQVRCISRARKLLEPLAGSKSSRIYGRQWTCPGTLTEKWSVKVTSKGQQELGLSAKAAGSGFLWVAPPTKRRLTYPVDRKKILTMTS